jgi:hypothetical protein
MTFTTRIKTCSRRIGHAYDAEQTYDTYDSVDYYIIIDSTNDYY